MQVETSKNMSKTIPFFLGAGLMLLVACTQPFQAQDHEQTIKVQIPVQDKNEYRLDIVELFEIQSLTALSGNFVEFLYNPKIKDGELSGKAPNTHFLKNKKSVYIPLDEVSLHVSALYYHLQNLILLNRQLDFPVKTGPAKVVMGLKFMRGNQIDQNNSYYDGDVDAILFVPYREEGLPLSVNAGVIAHEYFHSLFHKILFQPLISQGKVRKKTVASIHSGDFFRSIIGLPLKKSVAEPEVTQEKAFYEYLFYKSLNEGLADYWGWMYSQDPTFIERSLQGAKSRDLGGNELVDSRPVLTEETFKILYSEFSRSFDMSNPKIAQAILIQQSYVWGTAWALLMKNWAVAMSQEKSIPLEQSRHLVAKNILGMLGKLKDKISAADNNSSPNSKMAIETLNEISGQWSSTECKTFKQALPGAYECVSEKSEIQK